MVLHYGSATLTGFTMTDQVCLNKNVCVQDFILLGITKQVTFQGVAGLIGVSPNKGDGKSPETGLSLVHTLADAKLIPRRQSNFYFDNTNQGKSEVVFGNPNTTLMKLG